jgi:hypothetical protein
VLLPNFSDFAKLWYFCQNVMRLPNGGGVYQPLILLPNFGDFA